MGLAFELMLPLLAGAVQAAPVPEAAPADEGPVTRQAISRDTPLLDFDYVWPEAVSAEPKLEARLNEEALKSYDEALKNARENKADTEKFGGPFNQNSFARTWILEGQSGRLISLVENTNVYTGGAHPNHTTSALLWDKSVHGETQLAALFTSTDSLQSAIRPRFCTALDAERLKRREGERLDGSFSECPKFADLTIAPSDVDHNGRFEVIQLTADPYVAGPYAEGAYEILVPVNAALIAALRPEYRSEFEAQPAQ